MGLDAFNTDDPDAPFGKEKLANEELCPNCGKRGEDTEHWYWRCKTPHEECETLNYIPNSRAGENA